MTKKSGRVKQNADIVAAVVPRAIDRAPHIVDRPSIDSEKTVQDNVSATKQTRGSEEQYRLLFESNPQPMWVYDTETLGFLAVNRAAIEQYGWSEQEFMSMTIRDIRSPDELREFERTLAEIESGSISRSYTRHRRKNGDALDVDISANSIAFAGRPARLVLAHDITQRRRAERALRASEASMNAAQHIAHVGSWELDLTDLNNVDDNTVRWSDEMFRIAGYEPGEVHVTPELFFEHVHAEDREKIRAAVETAIRDRGSYSLIHGFTRRDGTQRILHEMGQLIYDPQTGQPQKILGTAHDITEQELSQAELVKTNRALLMYSSCSEALIRSSEEGELLEDICRIAVDIGGYCMAWVGYANDNAARTITPMAYAGHEDGYLAEINLSWDADSPYGKGPSGQTVRSGEALIIEDHAREPAFQPWLAQARQHGYQGSVALPLRDGTRTFGILNLYISEGKHFGQEEIKLLMNLANDLAFGILHLHSQRDNSKMQTAVLKVATSVSASSSSEFFENLARNMADAVGAQISFVTRLRPGKPATAYTIAAVVDGSVIENFDYPLEDSPYEDYKSKNEYLVDSALAETYPSSPCVRFGAQAYAGRLLRDSRGTPIGLVSVGFGESIHQTDFIASALKIFGARAAAELERLDAERAHQLLEAQLIEAQKMEAIGTLAGGIAHDFNNILTAIMGNAELARQDVLSNPSACESLAEIEKAALRAKELVQQILSFSRRQPTERHVIELFPIIEESIRLLRATLPARVEIVLAGTAFKPTVLGDPTQIEQVLLNLGTNAAHAMDGKPGRIEIRCELIILDPMTGTIISQLRPGEYARISISDNGHGMDQAILQRIFEPFFTTKPHGEGTGLGLSASHGIMRLHDGTIEVRSQPHVGSRFDLYFPVSQLPAVISDKQKEKIAPSAVQGQHILYVDDDEAIIFMVTRMLKRLGYRVSAYTDQQTALDALQSNPRDFDLFLSDYNMPGMSGVDLARLSRVIRPELPVVLLSGYITDELRKQAAACGVRELVFKPNTTNELTDVVHRLTRAAKH